jgi:hypothetical protein
LPFYFLLLMSHFQVPIANFFPKRNERWATQGQSTEPLVIYM